MFEMLEEANYEDKIAWGIVTQTDNGDITYLTEDYASYNFDFDLTMHTIVEFKDQLLEDIDNVIHELSKKTNTIDGYSVILTFSNPNLTMPYIQNKNELVEIRVEGSCYICKGNLLTIKDSLDTTFSIPSENLNDIKVPTKENLSKYSINPENRQLKTTGYYTEIKTFRAGIENQVEILVDLNNPICRYFLNFSNKRMQNPNVEVIITKKLRDDIIYSSKKIINDVNEGYTENGIYVLTISFLQNEDVESGV